MARQFNGSSQYGSAGSVSDFSFIQNTGDFTISVWAKLDNNAANALQVYAGNTASSGEKGFFFGFDNRSGTATKEVKILVGRGVSGFPTISLGTGTNAIADNNWHHIVAVASGSFSAIWIDGSSAASGSVSTKSTGNSSRTLNFGRYNYSTPGGYFDGALAEIAFWDDNLTSDEIISICNGTSADQIRPGSLTNYWKMIGGHSPEIDTISALGMTLTGPPTATAHPRIFYPKRRGIYLPSSGGGGGTTHSVSGTLLGDATLAGIIALLAKGSGSLSGDAAATGLAQLLAAGTGSLSGDATVSGILALQGGLGVSVVGQASVTGNAAAILKAVGSISGDAEMTGTVALGKFLAGVLSGDATANGTISAILAAAGSLTGDAATTGSISALLAAVASAAGDANTVGQLVANLKIQASVVGDATVAAILDFVTSYVFTESIKLGLEPNSTVIAPVDTGSNVIATPEPTSSIKVIL